MTNYSDLDLDVSLNPNTEPHDPPHVPDVDSGDGIVRTHEQMEEFAHHARR